MTIKKYIADVEITIHTERDMQEAMYLLTKALETYNLYLHKECGTPSNLEISTWKQVKEV
jgi:hypothetical protein